MRLTEKRLRAVISKTVRQVLRETVERAAFSKLLKKLDGYSLEELESALDELDETGSLNGLDLHEYQRDSVRETITRNIRMLSDDYESEDDSDESGYSHLIDRPETVVWIDGPIDHKWLKGAMGFYSGMYPPSLASIIAKFNDMLMGEPVDPDFVENYIKDDGTSNVTRQTVEALVSGLTGR